MTRSELYDTIIDGVYDSLFKLIDECHYGGASIEWDKDVTDREVTIDVSITIKPDKAKKPEGVTRAARVSVRPKSGHECDIMRCWAGRL